MSAGPRRLDLRGDPRPELGEVVEHVRAGGLIAYPTETVYGLGSTLSEDAVTRVREVKGRESDKPLIALVESAESVEALVWTEAAHELARVFWPGALTLVLGDPLGIFPRGVRDEKAGTVGVRVSPLPLVSRLLLHLGGPLTSTSLNLPGSAPAASGTEALEVASRLSGADILVLDVGTLPPSGPSTVVDCTGPEPVVIRRGTVPTGRLQCLIPEIHDRPR